MIMAPLVEIAAESATVTLQAPELPLMANAPVAVWWPAPPKVRVPFNTVVAPV